MNETKAIDEIVNRWVDRRSFAKVFAAGMGTVALGGASLGAQAPTITDTDILNFALNLEYLDAEFYTVITSGVTIDAAPFNIGITGVGTPGPTSGAARLDMASDARLNQTALELAYDERAHVALLRNALGSAAVAKPAIDFSAAAVTSIAQFLRVARILEDVGVSAYGGAAPLISDTAILGTAARIALAEGLHSGAVRLQMAQRSLSDIGPVDASDVVVSTNPQIGARLFTTDAQGLTAVRTPSQVLSIVYGPNAPAGTTSGLLYPNGMNGVINTV
ncbi:MAG: ferritin-like domain-containing protein [Vicinamibacterales bacterium]